MMNRKAFLEAYRAEVIGMYPWASKHPDRLERFMASVEKTMAHGYRDWSGHGPAVDAAWKAIGGKGKPDLAALIALPEGV